MFRPYEVKIAIGSTLGDVFTFHFQPEGNIDVGIDDDELLGELLGFRKKRAFLRGLLCEKRNGCASQEERERCEEIPHSFAFQCVMDGFRNTDK